MTNLRLGAVAFAIACSPLTAQWGQATPASSPSARSGHGMCYDAVGNRIVLFGGSQGFAPTSAETWAYDGNDWSQLSNGTAATGIELVQINGQIVLYGGMNTSFFGGPSVDQTLVFDGTSWGPATPTPTTTPGGLGNYGACALPGTPEKMLLYGGTPDSFFPIAAGGTWEYDGTDWTLISAASAPGPLERPAMCYHAGAGAAVMFGGIDPQIGGTSTTWLYAGGIWTAATVTGGSPAARTGAKMAYDSVRQVCVLSGGMNPTNGQPIVETWELSYDGATTSWTWTQIPSTTNAHMAAGTAFLPGARLVVEFGGLNPQTFSDYGDTWVYGARSTPFGAGCPGSFGTPALTVADAPRLGQSYDVTVSHLDPAVGLAIFVIGLSDQTSTLGPLPYDLGAHGMPNCSLLVSNDAVTFVSATAGSSTFSTPLPNVLAFLGLPMFHQGMSFDASANATGLTVSNAIAGTVGK